MSNFSWRAPAVPFEAQTRDGAPFTVWHVCVICQQPRSARYHTDHPTVDIDAPAGSICRRCEGKTFEQQQQQLEIVREIPPPPPVPQVILQEPAETHSSLSLDSLAQTTKTVTQIAPPRVLSFRHVKPFTHVSSPLSEVTLAPTVGTAVPLAPVVECAPAPTPTMAPPSSTKGFHLSPSWARQRYEESVSDHYSSVRSSTRDYRPPSRGNYPPSAPPSESVRDYPPPSSVKDYAPTSVKDYASPPIRDHQPSSMQVHPPSSVRDYPSTTIRDYHSTAIRDYPPPASRGNYPPSSIREYPPSSVKEYPPPPIKDYPPPLAQRQAPHLDSRYDPRTAPQAVVARPQRRVSFSKEDEIATLPPDLPSHSSNQPDSISRGLSHLRLHPSNISGMRSPHNDYEYDKHRSYEYVAKSETSYVPEPKYTPLSESPARERPLASDEDDEESYAHGPYRTENSPTPSMEVLVDNYDFVPNKPTHDTRGGRPQPAYSRPPPQKAQPSKGRDGEARGRDEDRGWTKFVTVREYIDSQGPYVEVEEKIVYDDQR